MKFGVVIFPGSNCDRDMIEALRNEFKQEVIILWHKDTDISMFEKTDCIVLPGGFSYGDYLRCGAIARFSPMMKSVIDFAERGGRVLGICNGFQVLCESGLLPGVLLRNAHQQFVCKNIYLKNVNITQEKPLKIPVAHGEGRYFIKDEGLKELIENDQVLYQYCTDSGVVNDESNPNGAVYNIACIRNRQGNVVGMMPHPERASSPTLNNTDGRVIFNALYGLAVNN